MKKFFITVALSPSCVLSVSAQKQMEASTLNLIGKPFESTLNPYHRVGTLIYKGFNRTENRQPRCSVGMAVSFKADTYNIRIMTRWGYIYSSHSTMPISYEGYDLYTKNANGQWRYAASGPLKAYKGGKIETFMLVENMGGTTHECMMYIPMYSEVISRKVGMDDDAAVEPSKFDFRHRIAVYGSLFTQGMSTDRFGTNYPMQFIRSTGLQIVSLATSRRCLIRSYTLNVLVEVKADAFIFDTFSNPNAELIRERLMPLISRLIAAHPAILLIFQRTIYHGRCLFGIALDMKKRAKVTIIEELPAKIRTTPKYEDVYPITPDASDAHETSVDGTCPSSHGYTL